MGKKRPSVSLVASVLESLPTRVHGTRAWYERVAPEHREEIAALKAAWIAGQFKVPQNTAARFIAKRLNELGISNVQQQGVNSWLGKP